MTVAILAVILKDTGQSEYVSILPNMGKKDIMKKLNAIESKDSMVALVLGRYEAVEIIVDLSLYI